MHHAECTTTNMLVLLSDCTMSTFGGSCGDVWLSSHLQCVG